MYSYTINDESYTGEKFCGTLNFIIQWGKHLQFCFSQVRKAIFCNILVISYDTYKINRKTFMVCRKSTKTTKFSPA